MHRNDKLLSLAALLAALVVASGTASAGGMSPPSDDGHVILQGAIISDGDNKDNVKNDFDVFVGGGGNGIGGLQRNGNGGAQGGNAVVNCQWLLGVNNIFLNVLAVESLALISDDDSLDFDVPFFATNHRGNGPPQVTQTSNGTASCEQDIGAVGVWLAQADGWGEPAPQAEAAMGALGGIGANLIGGPGMGGGASHAILQGLVIADGDNEDMVQNDADVSVFGSGNAVANCQMLIGWNTLAVNAGLVSMQAAISDDDSTTIDLPDRGRGPPEEAMLTARVDEDPRGGFVFLSSGDGHATCKQTVASIELHVGQERHIPRES